MAIAVKPGFQFYLHVQQMKQEIPHYGPIAAKKVELQWEKGGGLKGGNLEKDGQRQ
jgi:hypothetical protein